MYSWIISNTRFWVLSCIAGGLTFIISATIFYYTIRIYRVRGASMQPTATSGDWVIAETRRDYLSPLVDDWQSKNGLERGDLVIIDPSSADRPAFLKRLVAGPRDTIAMRDGTLYVNKTQQREPYVQESREDLKGEPPPGNWHLAHHTDSVFVQEYQPTGANWGPIKVPPKQWFTLGDNRDDSEDSRRYGFIGVGEIEAYVVYIL